MAFLPAVIAVYTAAGTRIDQPNAQGNYQPIILKLGTRLSYSSTDLMDGRTAVTIDGLAGTLAPDYTSDEYPAPSWAGTRPGHIVLSNPVTGSYNAGTDTLTISATVPVWTDTELPPHAYAPTWIKVHTDHLSLSESPTGTLNLDVHPDLIIAWSGNGISSAVTVPSLVIGDGLLGTPGTGTLGLSANILWSGNGISGSQAVKSVVVGSGLSASITSGAATVTASATAGTTVHGVTLRNLTSDTDGLLLVSGATVGDLYLDNYDADVAEVLVVGGPDVLVNCQTDPTENGIYHAEYFTSVYRLVRSTERAIGEQVTVLNGLIFKGSQWWCREKSVTEERWESLTGPSFGVTVLANATAGAAAWAEALRVLPPAYVTVNDDWDVRVRSVYTKDDGESNPVKFGRRGWSDTFTYSCSGSAAVNDTLPGIQFGDPWEGDATKRIKCEVDAGALKFSVYCDASTGYASRYMLAVTPKVRHCERFEIPT